MFWVQLIMTAIAAWFTVMSEAGLSPYPRWVWRTLLTVGIVNLFLCGLGPAHSQSAEQKAVNALGALDIANDAIRNTVGAYAAEVNQKMAAAKTDADAKAAALAEWWASYVKGLSSHPLDFDHDEKK